MKYLLNYQTFEMKSFEIGNIGNVNEGELHKRRHIWQMKNPNIEMSSGDYVKLIFENKGMYEAMWVQIQEKNDDIYKGILHNDPAIPAICMIVEHGDIVEFTYDEIMDYLSENQNDEVDKISSN